jgi:hypothetical protein
VGEVGCVEMEGMERMGVSERCVQVSMSNKAHTVPTTRSYPFVH